jgi:hypothetical protein
MGNYDILFEKALICSEDIRILSSIEMGATYLDDKLTDKALNAFERVLERNIKTPSAWIGMAFTLMEEAILNNAELDEEKASEYIDKGLSLCSDDNEQITSEIKIISLSLVLEYYTNAIKRTIEISKQARETTDDLSKTAGKKLVGAAFSGVIGLNSKSRLWKTIGYGGSIAGVTGALTDIKNSTELRIVSKGAFSTSINLVLSTIPIVKKIHRYRNIHKTVAIKIESALDSWQESVRYIFIEQSNRIDHVIGDTIGSLKRLKGKKDTKKYLEESNCLSEITNLIMLVDEVGLDNHITFEILKETDTQIKALGGVEIISDEYQKVTNRIINFVAIGALTLFAGLFLLTVYTWLGAIVLGLGICSFLAASFIENKTRNDMIEILEKLKDNKNIFTEIKKEDFDYSLLGT